MSKKKKKCPECKSENIELTEIKGSFSTYKCLDCKKIFEIRVFIQVSLSEKEKELIKEKAKEEHTSASNLMKKATFEYLRKLENPELFAKPSFNSSTLEELTKRTKKILELQELQTENQDILKEMNKTLVLIRNFSMRPDPKAKNTILNLFKAHTSLNPKEIIEKTNFDKDVVFSVITDLQNENLIEMTSKGRFKIK